MTSNLNITALQKRFDPSIPTFESSICPLMPPQSVASDAAKRNLVRFRERGFELSLPPATSLSNKNEG